jgi:hypothetical protein
MKVRRITLQPKDIPGAVFDANRRIEDHSVNELKRWLEVRGLKRSGNKPALVVRYVSYNGKKLN